MIIGNHSIQRRFLIINSLLAHLLMSLIIVLWPSSTSDQADADKHDENEV